VFYDAIGGENTAKIMNCMPKNSYIYLYGVLDGLFVKNISTFSLTSKNMTMKGLFLPIWLEEKGA
jgi:NADPH:quinone reductase-like Zn-dependent oxidoreductase